MNFLAKMHIAQLQSHNFSNPQHATSNHSSSVFPNSSTNQSLMNVSNASNNSIRHPSIHSSIHSHHLNRPNHTSDHSSDHSSNHTPSNASNHTNSSLPLGNTKNTDDLLSNLKEEEIRSIIQSAIKEIINSKGNNIVADVHLSKGALRGGNYTQEDKEIVTHFLFQMGMHYYQKQVFHLAEEYFKKSGYLGCSSSFYRLGILYMRDDLGLSRAVPYSYSKAFECFSRAGNMGHSGAVTNIGTLFFNTGKFKEAMEYYSLGAKMGCLYAYKNIGKMYESGNGVKKDNVTALHYFQKCGSQRHVDRAVRNILKETCYGAL